MDEIPDGLDGAPAPKVCAPWMAADATRLSLALLFVWFGALKLAGVSPAGELVARTFFFVPRAFLLPALGLAEVVIGILLVVPATVRVARWLLVGHLVGTFLSLVIVPELCFERAPFVLTTNGEFILKNLVLLSAAWGLMGARPVRASG